MYHHGVKHLCSCYDLLVRIVYLLDDHLLDDRHILKRYLNTHISSCDHDSIGHSDYVVYIVNALHILNLGDDIDIVTLILVKDLPDLKYIVG